jgi:8-amino-7-oxononanoate synthase
LVQLAQEFGALLVVDEAHATGVVGPQGMGLTCGKGVDLIVGTFGKACGSFGAYIACGERLWQYIINCCPGFIYTTALPPAVLGAVDAALELIPQMQESREELHRKADFVRCRLNEAGWGTGHSTTPIVPVLIGEEDKTLALAQWLETHGVLAVAIRPPTVPQGQSRLRLTLSVLHSWEHVEHLVELLQEWRGRSA